MTDLLTACSLDCPDACSIRVSVENERIVSIDAAPNALNPGTDGWICSKVKHTPELVHGADRVTEPLRRVGPKGSGEFEPISWDDALDLFAERVQAGFDSHGPESVVPYLYNSSAGSLASDGLSPLVWEALGTARTDITICALTSAVAWSLVNRDLQPADPADLEHSDLIVVWGANPNTSNSHLTPVLEDRRRAGAKLVVVDPRRIPIARRADLHLALRPGTDVVLAMGVANMLERDGRLARDFIDEWVDGAGEYLQACRQWTPGRVADVCGLTVADVEAFGEMYGNAGAAMLRVGWGPERNRNGGSSTRAILSLPALAGQYGRPGAGVFQSVRGGVGYDAPAVRRAVVGDAPVPARRAVNMNRLGRILRDDEGGRVEVLFVQGSNPAATCPEQAIVLEGLARDDLFTVVHELTMTDTTRWADLVLPATSQFEVDEIVGAYGSFVVQDAPAVIPRVGSSRTNDEVSCGLGVRLGLDARQWDPDPERVRRMALGDRLLPIVTRPSGENVQFRDVHPSRNLRLVIEDRDGVDRIPTYRPLETPDHPINLISPATSRTISTIFGNIEPASPDLRLHPAEAEARGLSAGDRARVSDGRHSIEVTVALGAELRPGLATMPKGMWLRDGHDGFTVNVLCPDDLSDLAGGATFNDARVEVIKI
jgi:anaerobic selenocysteine-containing dehydrogenase